MDGYIEGLLVSGLVIGFGLLVGMPATVMLLAGAPIWFVFGFVAVPLITIWFALTPDEKKKRGQ
jgi:uncharacterized oligopeptide transporter (OPT) family protein